MLELTSPGAIILQTLPESANAKAVVVDPTRGVLWWAAADHLGQASLAGRRS